MESNTKLRKTRADAMFFDFGFRRLRLAAGPYYDKPECYAGVKLAKEINRPFAVELRIPDFSVPSEKDLQQALIATLDLLIANRKVYVGCMGGIGRTGTFLAAMQRVANDYSRLFERIAYIGDPIAMVRAEYYGHAVETAEQERLVRSFDVAPVIDHLIGVEYRAGGTSFEWKLRAALYKLRRAFADFRGRPTTRPTAPEAA